MTQAYCSERLLNTIKVTAILMKIVVYVRGQCLNLTQSAFITESRYPSCVMHLNKKPSCR